MEFQVEADPDPLDVGFLETQIRREASAAMGLGDEVELAIFVRDVDTIVAGISGWTWGDCCELQSLWVSPGLKGRWLGARLLAAAEAEAAARGCTQTVHFTWDFQARALYERAGYELVGRVEGFPSGTDVLWYRKRLDPPAGGKDRHRATAATQGERAMTDRTLEDLLAPVVERPGGPSVARRVTRQHAGTTILERAGPAPRRPI